MAMSRRIWHFLKKQWLQWISGSWCHPELDEHFLLIMAMGLWKILQKIASTSFPSHPRKTSTSSSIRAKLCWDLAANFKELQTTLFLTIIGNLTLYLFLNPAKINKIIYDHITTEQKLSNTPCWIIFHSTEWMNYWCPRFGVKTW